MPGSVIQFPWKDGSLSPDEARERAVGILATPQNARLDQSSELRLEDPEQLLSVCELLRTMADVEPAQARGEAEFFFRFLESPRRSIGVFDEREYYLGELALIAGTACRVLAKRDEARHWFDLSEANFVIAHNASAHIARLAYQRLALRLEEREFTRVLQLAPRWVECFVRLELHEDALKCRFLEAIALKETERPEEATRALEQIKEEAKTQRLDRLAAIAGQNLFQIHAFSGREDQAIAEAQEAAAILGRLNNRVNLAKLQLGVGYLLRGQHRLAESIEAFRVAQRQFSEIEMHADVASTHLVLADLLLDAGQPAQAEWEIRAALPIIDELKLIPEGIAALSLLRDSLRRREIDRHALRNLNGYFEDLGS